MGGSSVSQHGHYFRSTLIASPQKSGSLTLPLQTKSPEVRQLDLAIADRALQVSPEGAEGCRSWSGVLYNLAKSGISCGSSKEVQQLFTVAVSPPTHSESLS